MFRLAVILVPVVLAVLVPGAAAAASVNRGKIIAQHNCARCHATGPQGASTNPKSPPFRTLAQRYPLKDLEEALAEGITVGREGLEMPAFEFEPRQIADLMAYLASIQVRAR